MQDINSWTLRDGAIVLFSRGSVVSRLAESGAIFQGTVSGLETPITLSR